MYCTPEYLNVIVFAYVSDIPNGEADVCFLYSGGDVSICFPY